MERPPIFITYFQSPFQIVHIYEVLHFEYFFQKFYGRFNLMTIFLAFHHLREKLWKELTIL